MTTAETSRTINCNALADSVTHVLDAYLSRHQEPLESPGYVECEVRFYDGFPPIFSVLAHDAGAVFREVGRENLRRTARHTWPERPLSPALCGVRGRPWT